MITKKELDDLASTIIISGLLTKREKHIFNSIIREKKKRIERNEKK